MYNEKAIEKLIETMVIGGDCPSVYGLRDCVEDRRTCGNGTSESSCRSCWKESLQIEPKEWGK